MLRAAACFKTIYVPRNIEVYKQFTTTMVENSLKYNINWEMDDDVSLLQS